MARSWHDRRPVRAAIENDMATGAQPQRRARGGTVQASDERFRVFPSGTRVNERGRLEIGGCDAVELAREFGTPAYVVAEDDLRARAQPSSTRWPPSPQRLRRAVRLEGVPVYRRLPPARRGGAGVRRGLGRRAWRWRSRRASTRAGSTSTATPSRSASCAKPSRPGSATSCSTPSTTSTGSSGSRPSSVWVPWRKGSARRS